MKPVIEVKGLSKSYTISHELKADYNTVKDTFSGILKKRIGEKKTREVFWALNDINFSVNPGEVFGVIGRNGSGKSTLLKILSRIVEPTKGEVTMHGRVASLLEVGTGFHPELTGRENIYFNGSMLGMSRQEISKKFDDIVTFAETEKFLDTPVKFYSSGMYVRLAFSVAAHLEPDILILDEVLAVGDAAFQKKSLDKILETMHQNRTVLFVSHSMGAIRQLCSRGILLKDGNIAYSGEIDGLVDGYMSMIDKEVPETILQTVWSNDGSTDNDYIRLNKIYITDDTGKIIAKSATNNKDYWVTIEANIKKPDDLLTIGYTIHTSHKTLLYISFPTDKKREDWPKLKKGKVIMRGKLPRHLLNAETYKISIAGGLHNKFWIFDPDEHNPSVQFNISGGLSESPYWKQARSGLLAPIIDWEIVSV